MKIFLARHLILPIAYLTRIWYTITLYFSRTPTRIPMYIAPGMIAQTLRFGGDYEADRPWLDWANHPSLTQDRIDGDDPIGDCDDHALYWCAALQASGLAGEVYLGVYYAERDGGVYAHAVCVYMDSTGWRYADYREPVEVADRWSWAAVDADKRNGVPLGAAMIRIRYRDGRVTLGGVSARRL